MDKGELLEELKSLDRDLCGDFEISHSQADSLLLDYIDDEEINEAFANVGKWYS